MTAYVRVEVLHSFAASPVGGGEWSTSCPILYRPRETDSCTICDGCLRRGWGGSGGSAGLDLWGRGRFVVLDENPSTAPGSSNI